MNVSVAEIERVVAEVLQALTQNVPAAPVAPQTPVAERPAEAKPVADSLVLSDRVVTLSQLDGRLGGVRQVVVSPQAIVTPAVRDELHRRGLSLTTAAPAEKAVDALRLVVVTTGTSFDPVRLIAAVEGQQTFVVSHSLDCLLASCDLLAHQVGEGKTLGLLLTRYVSPALCLANRLAGVRAVTASNPAGVRLAVGTTGGNVLVLDPAAFSFFALRQMVLEYRRGGVRACPEVFLARLG